MIHVMGTSIRIHITMTIKESRYQEKTYIFTEFQGLFNYSKTLNEKQNIQKRGKLYECNKCGKVFNRVLTSLDIRGTILERNLAAY